MLSFKEARLGVLLSLCCGAIVAADEREWGVVLDCGSSGTRAHIYSWTAGDVLSLVETVPPAGPLQLDDYGISHFAEINDPSGVGAYLEPLLQNASRVVPPSAIGRARIRAYATAGMRLYLPAVQAAIWKEAAAALAASDFKFVAGDALTISGNYEGLYNWMSLDYIVNKSAAIRGTTAVGGLDMGGASTQITFAPTDGVIVQDAYHVTRDDRTERLYSHSYMRFGVDQAVRRFYQQLQDTTKGANGTALPSPCHNPGYSIWVNVTCADSPGTCLRELTGQGNWTACQALVGGLLHTDYECLLPPCAAMGVYQPSLAGRHIYAVSAFWYGVKGVGAVPKGADEWNGPRAKIEAAGDSWCKRGFAEISADKYASAYCFNMAYMDKLLDAYGVTPESTSITYAGKVDGFSLGWTLGAQLSAIAEQGCALAPADGPGSGSCPKEKQLEAGLAVGVPLSLVAGGALGMMFAKHRAGAAKSGALNDRDDLSSAYRPM